MNMYVCVCIGFIVLIVEHTRQQHVFTHNTHTSVTVMIFFDINLPISILTQLLPLTKMRYVLLVFSLLLNNRDHKSLITKHFNCD